MSRPFRPLMIMLLLPFCLWAAPEQTSGEPRYVGSMGYLVDGMEYIREKDMRLALELWLGELMAFEQIEATITYYEEPAESVAAFIAFKHDMLTVNPYFYLRNRERLDAVTQSYWVFQMGTETFEKMVLLARRDGDISSPAELRGTLAVRDDNYMGRLFLDAETLKAVHRPYKRLIERTLMTKNHSTAVLKLFFKQADAAVVPHYVFELMTEMNPALRRDLYVLAESPRVFAPIMGMFHRKTPETMHQAYSDFVKELSSTPKGRNILELFKMKAMHRLLSEALEPLRTYYREYLDLKHAWGGDYE
jgi:ABC-type phosphate/phosphonate transport system substrate-binding protein